MRCCASCAFGSDGGWIGADAGSFRIGWRAGRREELVDVLEADEPGDLARRIVKVGVRHQIGLAGSECFLLQADDRHDVGKLLGLAAGAESDIDGHVVALLPVARVDGHPLVAQTHRLRLLAMLADLRMQQREHVAHAGLGEDPCDQFDLGLRRVTSGWRWWRPGSAAHWGRHPAPAASRRCAIRAPRRSNAAPGRPSR